MIELQNDQLHFSFPSVVEELRRLTNRYIEDTLPRLLAEDCERAYGQLLDSNPEFRRVSQSSKDKVRRCVGGASAHAIVEAFQDEIRRNEFSFHDEPGQMHVEFQRTLRIPDNDQEYLLPPGFGCFPVRHLDDYSAKVPASWLDRGGVMMPMYQSEALWLNFQSSYPFTLKIASGKINALTGEPWRNGLNRNPQDYLVLPDQPWLDGFAVEKGIIRQFVAMPLGKGYSVEEQLSGKAEFGGIQLQAFPMKPRVYFESEVLPRLPRTLADILLPLSLRDQYASAMCCCEAPSATGAMGLGAGGRMRQEVYEDEHDLNDWDLKNSSRCFVHLCDALVWRQITGTNPPHTPVTAREYERARLPWFDFYRDDVAVLEGSKTLAGVKSAVQISKEKGDMAVVGNDSVESETLVDCGPKKRTREVREWGGP